MEQASAERLTQVLDAVNAGEARAAEELLPLVYEELRRLAADRMAEQPPGQTLQATALVHEAWLRLGANPQTCWNGRTHFFRTAAETMRQILVDRARSKQRLKRGANAVRVASRRARRPSGFQRRRFDGTGFTRAPMYGMQIAERSC